jgi:rfaE bifunctional protein kinase chain/domain
MDTLSPTRAKGMLGRLKRARVAVFGDFCLDAYWRMDTGAVEQSVETGLPTQRVREQRYSAGGAGNVAVNLAALGVARVTALGVLGTDPFGDRLAALLSAAGVDASGLYRGQSDWQTCVYAKPYRGDVEQSRLDFGAFNVPCEETVRKLEDALERAAETHDVLIVNQQIPQGLVTDALIAAVNRLAAARPDVRIIVDARHVADRFTRVCLKLNEAEAARVASALPASDGGTTPAGAAAVATALWRHQQRPVFITRGERGVVVADEQGTEEIPGIQVPPPVDTVGAGDMLLATLAAVLATDGSKGAPRAAGGLANLSAAVTVKKLGTTGTANPAEILALAKQAEYVFRPDVADDPRRAVFSPRTEIETVRPLPGNVDIRHAIFDHDGTLSTLREGWEEIMEPMMVRAILGPCYRTADEVLFSRVTQACREFIDRTTGIQTLVQMQGLVALVRQFGCVPREEILDEHGYKRIYNEALLDRVRRRMAKLARGELSSADFQVKNAHALLLALHRRGVVLYLASGTDVQDVVAEANAMGYAGLFGGRIFGAVGSVKVEAKKVVLARIMREHGLAGTNLATFGDGPVEIRETRRVGGVTVGVASDEVRRFGLNPAKRRRLIRAGADVIVPDFSELDALLELLRFPRPTDTPGGRRRRRTTTQEQP